ncbi:MAG: class I SAM-dependent methyltransferase family protein [Candidatus Thorarchaeota archaeon]|nr:class I SAM-dependent methyltransferase family protein [Candidatus Thorarchaeota archaeon]
MTKENPYLCIPVEHGEQIRRRLIDLELLNTDFKLVAEDGELYIPLIDHAVLDQILPDLDSIAYSTGTREFPSTYTGPTTLRDALEGILTEEQLDLLPRAYDLIGDIAVLEIPEELSDFQYAIGEAFLQVRSNFTTILGKKGAIKGTLRTREYVLLAGLDKTSTTHTEYGCKIAVNLAKAYFSPRLLEEHNRIAQLVGKNEHVVDMFTGVGPFALHIARKVDCKVTAVDINPNAIALLKMSMPMNRLIGQIEAVNHDIRNYVKATKSQIADRVIMNHPSGSSDFISEACRLLKRGGIMHYYDFIGGEDPEGAISVKIKQLVSKEGRRIDEISLIRRVRDSAPYEYHIVVDAIIL